MQENVAVIIVNYNGTQYLKQCISSIKATFPLAEIIVVDNSSEDNSLEILRCEYPEVRVVTLPINMGYGQAANIGANLTSSEFLIISNVDVEFLPEAIPVLVNYLSSNERVGIAGAQQLYPDGSWQRSYGRIPGLWQALLDLTMISVLELQIKQLTWSWFRANRFFSRFMIRPRDVGYVDGAVMAIKRNAFVDIKGFDPDFFFYAEDADLCFRLRQRRWKILHVSDARVLHYRGATSARLEPERYFLKLIEANKKFVEKHGGHSKLVVYKSLMSCHVVIRAMLRLLVNLVSFRRQGDFRNFEYYKKLWLAWIK